MNDVTLLGLALVLDAVAGDPRWLPHPVIWMGNLITTLEKFLNRGDSARGLRWRGIFTVVFVVFITGGCSWGLLYAASQIAPELAWVLTVVMLYYVLAGRSLAQAALAVAKPLGAGDVPAARQAIAMYVGRDTGQLSEGEIARATVETVAENYSDGFVAPLFYAVLGGAPLAMAYKAVNTMDSMLGYKNTRYLHFGWAAARFDDLANFVPARIAAAFLLIAGIFAGKNPWPALRTWWQDAAKHPSPNGGATEAVMAGLLGVALGGVNYYGGVASERGVLGKMQHPLSLQTLRQALVVYCLACLVAAGFACLAVYFFGGWLLPFAG
jgi:adenosylcobinamide-phosphate synthase